MNTEKVKVKIKLENGATVPTYATEGSVGFDLKALGIKALYSGAREWPLEVIKRKVADSGKIIVKSFDRALLLTGIYVELPIGTEIQIRPRSGRSLKTGLYCNSGNNRP
jgi:dUTP pyrophosphatase